jgi:hypothetical protein
MFFGEELPAPREVRYQAQLEGTHKHQQDDDGSRSAVEGLGGAVHDSKHSRDPDHTAPGRREAGGRRSSHLVDPVGEEDRLKIEDRTEVAAVEGTVEVGLVEAAGQGVGNR